MLIYLLLKVTREVWSSTRERRNFHTKDAYYWTDKPSSSLANLLLPAPPLPAKEVFYSTVCLMIALIFDYLRYFFFKFSLLCAILLSSGLAVIQSQQNILSNNILKYEMKTSCTQNRKLKNISDYMWYLISIPIFFYYMPFEIKKKD